MTEQKQYFTEEEAVEKIITVLEYFTDAYADLHDEAFNTDYYIIGTYQAEQALQEYGVFEALRKVSDYLLEVLGEIGDDNLLTDPEKLASMLWYIKGYEALENADFSAILEEAEKELELDDLWNSEATPEVNQYIINKLEAYIKEAL